MLILHLQMAEHCVRSPLQSDLQDDKCCVRLWPEFMLLKSITLNAVQLC